MCLGKQKWICCRSWLTKAWSNVMSPSTERFHKWNHYFRLHCYDFFFLQGTALPPLLSAPLKYVQLIPHSCLGFALETLSAGPCPSVLPTPAWVGPFNKWYQGLLSVIWISMESIPREYFKTNVVSCKSKSCLELTPICIEFWSFSSSILKQKRVRGGERFHSFQLPINSRVMTLCLAFNSVCWVPPPSWKKYSLTLLWEAPGWKA